MNITSTQRQLLALLLPATGHIDVPARLQGAARKLWGHVDGPMVSLGHPGGSMTARLTGRGRRMAESIMDTLPDDLDRRLSAVRYYGSDSATDDGRVSEPTYVTEPVGPWHPRRPMEAAR